MASRRLGTVSGLTPDGRVAQHEAVADRKVRSGPGPVPRNRSVVVTDLRATGAGLRRDPPQRVVVASSRPEVLRLLRRVVRHAGHLVVEAQHGLEVLALLRASSDAPSMYVLDWDLPTLTALELCRLLRQHPGGAGWYVLLVSGHSRGGDLLEALAAGADDVLVRPFRPLEAVARLRVGERVLASHKPRPQTVAAVLREALDSPGGEVVVRRGEVVGRIFVHEARVAWVHISTESSSIESLFADGAPGEGTEGLSAGPGAPRPPGNLAAVRAALEEGRRHGLPFSEVLVERGLIDRAELSRRLRAWLAHKLRQILALSPATALFVPHARRHHGGLSFRLDELLPPELVALGPRLEAGAAPPPAATGADSLFDRPVTGDFRVEQPPALDELLTIDPRLGAVLVDVGSGRTVARVGEPLDRDLLWATVRYLGALADAREVDSMLVTTGGGHHLVAQVPGRPRHYLIAVLPPGGASMAAARALLTSVARRI